MCSILLGGSTVKTRRAICGRRGLWIRAAASSPNRANRPAHVRITFRRLPLRRRPYDDAPAPSTLTPRTDCATWSTSTAGSSTPGPSGSRARPTAPGRSELDRSAASADASGHRAAAPAARGRARVARQHRRRPGRPGRARRAASRRGRARPEAPTSAYADAVVAARASLRHLFDDEFLAATTAALAALHAIEPALLLEASPAEVAGGIVLDGRARQRPRRRRHAGDPAGAQAGAVALGRASRRASRSTRPPARPAPAPAAPPVLVPRPVRARQPGLPDQRHPPAADPLRERALAAAEIAAADDAGPRGDAHR